MNSEESIHSPQNPQKSNLRIIQIANRNITLLGTAHVSKTSVSEVRHQMAHAHYDAIAIELCQKRYRSLIDANILAEMDLLRIFRENRVLMTIANLALAAYQQHIADELGIEPGAEMKAAIEMARQMNIPIWLIDRDITITLRRMASNLSSAQRAGLLMGLFSTISTPEIITEEEIEELKKGEGLESTLFQLAEQNQSLFKPLIEERDEYMALKLQLQLNANDSRNVLAIVGAGHLPGIARNLETPTTEPPQIHNRIAELDLVKKRGKWLKTVHWLVVALILAGFTLALERNSKLFEELLIEWIVINGGLTALAGALAAAHPLTILVAFIVSPIMILNPFHGAGRVVAATEYHLRKPGAQDFMNLRRETGTLKGWWKNRASRTLLVHLFVTLASVLGIYIAGLRMLERLLTG